jgi:hypothetical protein
LLAAVLPEIYTGIKIPTNPADWDCQILGSKALKTGNWTDLVNDRFRRNAGLGFAPYQTVANTS